jgi:hypothetical protein
MKSTIETRILLAVSLLVACFSCDAFGFKSANSNNKMPVSSTPTTSRQNFLAAMAGGLLTASVLASPAPVWAKEAEYTKGSKNDPDVQAKLSVCMYECTKPKGSEQKTRAECIVECKQKCITARP